MASLPFEPWRALLKKRGDAFCEVRSIGDTRELGELSVEVDVEPINELVEGCPFTDGRRPSVIYADPSIFVKRRLTEVMNHSPADVFAEHGLWLTKANNDRVNGWRDINYALLN